VLPVWHDRYYVLLGLACRGEEQMMRVSKLGRRVVQIAAVVALGAGITLGTTAVLADDAATETEPTAPQVVYEWPEPDVTEENAPEPRTTDPDPAAARTAGLEWT
jgi:hypothetical protein